VLESKGIRATVRRTLGADIAASCGQLRREEAKAQTETL
jgi:23S rRNA (adenine2503-C2)-methyltransferase